MTIEFTDVVPGTDVERGLAKDDLIVIAGAGGFIAGSLTRFFIERFRVECLRSILVNTHLTEASYRAGVGRYFFSSSACAYNTDLQKTPEVIALKESDAYPALSLI